MLDLETLFAACLLAGAALPLAVALRLARSQDPRTLARLLLSQRRRFAPLFGVLLATSLWVGSYALELMLVEPGVTIWLHRLVYVGIACIPPAVLLTALEVSARRPSRQREVLLWAVLAPIPLVTMGLSLSNAYQGWLWAPGPILEVGPLTPIGTVRGPWFPIHTAYSYLCLAIAFGLLTDHYVREHKRFRDAAAILVAFLAPWVANALHVFFEVGDEIDLTPAAFLITGMLLYRTVDRDLLAEVLPLARATVLEKLGDAVFVLGDETRILDANAAALDLLAQARPDLEISGGLPALEECWPALARQLASEDPTRLEVQLETTATGEVRRFDLRVTLLERIRGLPALKAVALRDVTRRRESEAELYRRAHYDGLTGLPNRDHFFERMSGALEFARGAGHHLAVLLLDLDRFKRVNDTSGHAAGDALLRSVADALPRCLRGSDVVACLTGDGLEAHMGRLGGDEFAVVLPRIASAQDAGDVAMRLIRAIEASSTDFADAGEDLGVSIGISIFPVDGQDSETLLKCADVALYQAKEWGGNRFEYSNSRLSRLATRRLAIDRELRSAIELDQLSLVYQPKVRLREQGVSGMEALMRWTHPEMGFVAPAEFIAIAEKNGIVRDLGVWAIERACEQIREWRDAGLEVPPVAVNVSGLQLSSPDMVSNVTNSLVRHQLRPEDLELEITERTLLSSDESTFVALRDLRAIGVRLALDDFGTGYSALACLNRFQVDTLKIDQSLLEGVDTHDRAVGLLSSVIALAHTLEMKVVAEGVERDEIASILHGLGCDEAQGYLYSRPLPPDELAEFLTAS